MLVSAAFFSCKKDLVSSVSSAKQKTPVVPAAAKHDTIPNGSCFNIRLQQDSAALDETSVIFKQSASSTFNDQEDARYFQGMGKANLWSFTGDGTPCAIQTTSYTGGMSIVLGTQFRHSGTYLLKVSFLKMPSAKHIWLHDGMKNDSLDLRTRNYVFDVNTADTTSYGNNRFKVILR
jgi:hypothetical protein